MTAVGHPTTLLAELTHRCPLHCPYCSNPIELAQRQAELTTADWCRLFTEARALGVLQLGLSGGEPLLRKDVEQLVAHARSLGLYTTLVTSGLGLTRERAHALRAAGLDHLQLSMQDAEQARAERIAGAVTWEKKQAAALLARELDIAFSVNVVLHRANLDHLEEIVAMAAAMGADRLELANTQYYGWASLNRAALLPTRAQLERADEIVARARAEHRGRMQIIYVAPDYHGTEAKPCMGGWGAVYIVVAPDGRVLPCHAATQITTLAFDNARDHSLEWIWRESPAFQAYRGDDWMREPCRGCALRHQDHGGCRCQAFMLTGDAAATDPVCGLSPDRHRVDAIVAAAESGATTEIVYQYRDARAPIRAR